MTRPHLATLCALVFTLSPAAGQADSTLEAVSVSGSRDMRYCEFLLFFDDKIDVYNTTSSSNCDPALWAALDIDALAKAHGAKMVRLNGPKFWTADSQVVGLGGHAEFGGIAARYAATLPLSAASGGEGAKPYATFTTHKTQRMLFKAGLPIYELVDDQGRSFVLNAYGDKVKDGKPDNLAGQLTPTGGWSFRVRVLEEDLVQDLKGEDVTLMAADELQQYYSHKD